MNSSVETFQTLQKQLTQIKFSTMEYVDFSKALSIETMQAVREEKHFSLKKIVQLLLSFLFSTTEYTLEEEGSDEELKPLFFLFHDHNTRKDYVQAFSNVRRLFSSRFYLTGKSITNRIHRKLHLKGIGLIIPCIRWAFQLKAVHCSLALKTQYLHELVEAKKWVMFLEKLDSKRFNAVITYFDARSLENITAQYFKHHNIPTITLQHGHFISTTYTDTSYIIGIPFEGFVSDYLFVWGEYTKREAMKNGIVPDRIRVVGNPIYIGATRAISRQTSKQNVIGVILDGGELLYETNKKMLEIAFAIANEYGYKVVIKPHPAYDISPLTSYIDKSLLERICPKGESVVEYAHSVDFSLAMGSSVYSELLHLKSIVFRFVHPDYIDYFKGLDWGVFTKKEELDVHVQMLEEDQEAVMRESQKAAELLCVSGDVAKNYIAAVNEAIDVI